jgi:hypothetical protein
MRIWVAVVVVLVGVLAAACQTDDLPVESVAAVRSPTPAVGVSATTVPEQSTPTVAPAPTATATPMPEPTAVPTRAAVPTPSITPTTVPEPTATPDPAPAYLSAVLPLKEDADSLTGRLLEAGFVPPSPTDDWSTSIEFVAIELASLVDDWQRVNSPPAFMEFHDLYLISLQGWLRVAQVNAHWPRIGPDLEQQLLVSKEHQETYDATLEAVAVAQAAYELVAKE